MSIRTAIIAVFAVLVTACGAKTPPPFDAALKAHFEAIQNRDIEAYTKTITADPNLPLIFPEGTMLMTRAEVIDFHKTWFADPNWVYEPKVIGTLVSGNAAVATIRYAYRDNPDGPPRSAFLGLVFELQNGEWRLIHDQNTRIIALQQAANQKTADKPGGTGNEIVHCSPLVLPCCLLGQTDYVVALSDHAL